MGVQGIAVGVQEPLGDRISAYGDWSGHAAEVFLFGERSGKQAIVDMVVNDGQPDRVQRSHGTILRRMRQRVPRPLPVVQLYPPAHISIRSEDLYLTTACLGCAALCHGCLSIQCFLPHSITWVSVSGSTPRWSTSWCLSLSIISSQQRDTPAGAASRYSLVLPLPVVLGIVGPAGLSCVCVLLVILAYTRVVGDVRGIRNGGAYQGQVFESDYLGFQADEGAIYFSVCN